MTGKKEVGIRHTEAREEIVGVVGEREKRQVLIGEVKKDGEKKCNDVC